MAEKKRKRKTSRTSEERRLERERFETVTRLLERRLERGFAALDRRAGKPPRPWRESADERVEELYRGLEHRSSPPGDS
jgi:hypothetical protein